MLIWYGMRLLINCANCLSNGSIHDRSQYGSISSTSVLAFDCYCLTLQMNSPQATSNVLSSGFLNQIWKPRSFWSFCSLCFVCSAYGSIIKLRSRNGSVGFAYRSQVKIVNSSLLDYTKAEACFRRSVGFPKKICRVYSVSCSCFWYNLWLHR